MPAGSGSFRTRIFLLGALFLGCAFLLVYRLYEFQWLQREKYREQASRNYERRLDVPAQRVTSCAFGGTDLSTLYITSAREGLSPPSEHAGSLFALDPGVTGLPAGEWAG
jgi:hypothetical protein